MSDGAGVSCVLAINCFMPPVGLLVTTVKHGKGIKAFYAIYSFILHECIMYWKKVILRP